MSTLRTIFVLGAIGLAGCATTTPTPGTTIANACPVTATTGATLPASQVTTAANGACAFADAALVLAPALQAAGSISATSAQDIERDANAVIAAAQTAQQCVVGGTAATCDTASLDAALSILTSITPKSSPAAAVAP